MTVIITGQATGILNSSLETQGIANTIGNLVAATGLNLSSGNVIYQQEDSLLVSQGTDFGVVRTYNARARMSDDSGLGDGRWRLSTARRDTSSFTESNGFESAIDNLVVAFNRITADPNANSEGVGDAIARCANTPFKMSVNSVGCPDTDNNSLVTMVAGEKA